MCVLGQTVHIPGEKQVEILLLLSSLSDWTLDLQQIITATKTMSACDECYEGKWWVPTRPTASQGWGPFEKVYLRRRPGSGDLRRQRKLS